MINKIDMKHLIYLFLLALIFINCNKEKSAPPQKPIEELLVASSWKFQKLQIQNTARSGPHRYSQPGS
jgi:hypothetical protein